MSTATDLLEDLATPRATALVVRAAGPHSDAQTLSSGRDEALLGRRSECDALDRLVAAALAGRSGALVVRGEAGVGKSALLAYLRSAASGCRVAQAAGVQAEMELAFAGLHQVCGSMLDRLDRLPDPQRDALVTAFGLAKGVPSDRFFVGLAVLNLFAEVAADRPLLCLVDDAQWLDRASAQVLAFVARRLEAESVAMVFATRDSDEDFMGLPDLEIRGMRPDDARTLLHSVLPGPLDPTVRARIVAEARGNPLALLELPRGLTPAELAGGFALPDAPELQGRIEQSFQRRLAGLPEDTRRLLVIAAADPLGEPLLVWHAARLLGVEADALGPAVSARLLSLDTRVRFRHPLVRSAVYRTAPPEERRVAHAALADATDPDLDPDRHAWHRAHAAAGPDETVAAELERSAGRAQARGGLAAAGAFLEKATALTTDPVRRGGRALAAAQAKRQAGAPDAALALLSSAESGPLDELQSARADLLRARILFELDWCTDAPRLLFDAAKRLEPLDLDLARDTYLDALCAMVSVGERSAGCDAVDIACAALAAPRRTPARAVDLLLHGVSLQVTEGYAAAAPALRKALGTFDSDDASAVVGLGWGWFACYLASALWEHEIELALAVRHVELVRTLGATAVLPATLLQLIGIHMRNGELDTADAIMQEADAAADATRSHTPHHGALVMAAFRGREAEARALIAEGSAHQRFFDTGLGRVVVQFASALLYNGLGRYEDAFRACADALEHPEPVGKPCWTLPELVEAGVRSGARDTAERALRELAEQARISGTPWARGLDARARALLADGKEADRLYREAIARLTGAGSDVDLARAELLYGEWLRRDGRRVDAREHLRIAHDMLAAMGVGAFAARAERELLASGEHVRRRSVDTVAELTPQEAQIARLARDGLSNPQIGQRLFISPRTVEYHLGKVFTKLGISARTQLERVLPSASIRDAP